MPNFNRTIIVGHLTRDPEMRSTVKGTAVASFTVAVNRKWKDDNSEREEIAWVDVTAWGKQAEVIGKNLGKGAPILIEGRLKTDSWDDKKTGDKRSKLVVVLESFQFLGGGEKRAASAPTEGAAPEKEVDDDVPF